MTGKRTKPPASSAARVRHRGKNVTRAITIPPVPLAETYEDEGLWEIFGGRESASGVRVTESTSLCLPAVWRAVNLLSSGMAKMPTRVMRRVGDEASTPDRRHAAYRLLARKPNDYMTAFIWKQVSQQHALLRGNAYTYVFRRGGEPAELLPLLPQFTWPIRENGKLWYVTLVEGEPRLLKPADVIHIKGLGYDGLVGYSVLRKAKDSMGLGLGAQRFGAVFFKNGVRTSGILIVPHTMNQNAVETLRKDWDRVQTGLTNAHKILVLREGTTYQQLSVNPDDAQFLETRQFENREIGNWFGVPSHKLGDKEGQAYNSLEQENQSWLDDSIDPWAVNWEEELADKLLSESEKETDSHFVKFDRRMLVRADVTARSNYYDKMVRARLMLPDEARAMEDMNPLPNGEGQNLLPLPNQSIKEQKMRRRLRAFQTDAMARMARRIGVHARRAAGDHRKLREFVDTELSAHAPVVAEAMRSRRAADAFMGVIAAELDKASLAAPEKLAAEVDRAMRKFELKLSGGLAQ